MQIGSHLIVLPAIAPGIQYAVVTAMVMILTGYLSHLITRIELDRRHKEFWLTNMDKAVQDEIEAWRQAHDVKAKELRIALHELDDLRLRVAGAKQALEGVHDLSLHLIKRNHRPAIGE